MTYVNAKYIYGGHAITSGRVLADLREGKLAAEWVGGQWRIDKDVADVYVAKLQPNLLIPPETQNGVSDERLAELREWAAKLKKPA